MKTVDLSHPITVAMPVWPQDPLIEITTLATVEENCFLLNQLTVGEHSGTHFGVPAHFVPGGLTAEAVPSEALIAPGVVLDIRSACTANPDYVLTIKDILIWETTHLPIPPRSYVLTLTGWSERWNEPARYFGLTKTKTRHYPGFGEESVVFLMEERDCLGLGIDTPGIDPGFDEDFLSNSALFKRGGYHLENLTNLEYLPAHGFTLFIGLLPVSGGSGSPARVLAQFQETT
ncbi:MAG TPA: cyclase family protein [Atribacteraceae bacterium]|nr:cyclase family protein [Atribacteraceae bacterium]